MTTSQSLFEISTEVLEWGANSGEDTDREREGWLPEGRKQPEKVSEAE